MLFSKNITWLTVLLTGLALLAILVLPQTIRAGGDTVCDTGCPFSSIQAAVDGLDAGAVIQVGPGVYQEHVVIDKPMTVFLNGAQLGPGSPAFTITGADVSIHGPGLLAGGGSSDPAVLLQSGADNFILDGVEITGWRHGVQVTAPVTSFKMVNNWLHDNIQTGLQVDSPVVMDGVATIEGNLFKQNGLVGIQNDSSMTLVVGDNSWGDLDGPPAGDGVSANVQVDGWNFYEIYLDVDPDHGALQRQVLEGETLDVKLKNDAHNIYGLSFKLNWEAAYLDLNTVTLNAFWEEPCEVSDSVGQIAGVCYLKHNTPAYSALDGDILTLNFTIKSGAELAGNGPWQAMFDLAHEESDASAAAVGGVKVWVNNAGFGAPGTQGRDDISDAEDGKLLISGLANYSGLVTLEGRTDHSGAVVQVYDLVDKSTATEMAEATSAASGNYYTAHLAPEVLHLGSSYYLFIDRALYLPTTIMGVDLNLLPLPSIPTYWQHDKLLSKRLYTSLSPVLLLGGDATDDNVIDILDAGCIGRDYGQTPAPCENGGSSDVNGDGVVDLYDLTLMSGNYTLNYSPWSP